MSAGRLDKIVRSLSAVLVDIRTDGASIGALSLFNGEKAALDAETVEDTFLIKIPRDRFFEAVHLYPAIPRFYLKSFADTFLSKAFEEIPVFCSMRFK